MSGESRKEARRILEDARAQAGRVFDELDRMSAAAEQERSAQQENESARRIAAGFECRSG